MGLWVLGSGVSRLRVWGFRSRVQGMGFRVWGSGFGKKRNCGSGFGAWRNYAHAGRREAELRGGGDDDVDVGDRDHVPGRRHHELVRRL